MKNIVKIFSLMTTALLLSAIAILAAEQCSVSFGEYEKLVQSNVKNQCLVVAKNCATEANTVQQRVNELRVEIAKGSDVYTPDELMTLKKQLQWIESDSGNQFI